MHLDSSTVRVGTKSYTRHLLRESYRENGKVKHRTIANLSKCSEAEIEALRLAFRHKQDLASLLKAPVNLDARFKLPPIDITQGLSFGAVHVVAEVARHLGITRALGADRQGQLALWQVIARVMDQGSRLSAVRLAGMHAMGSVSGLEGLQRFDEDDLYANLDWLAEQQSVIEQRLFEQQKLGEELFLYDVTSSYLEGEQNAFGAFGYNRDKKRGKRQIVIGLLCNSAGRPLSIEVFMGNTQDTQTFAAQIDKVAERFGGGSITFVGDRGMIKGPQIADLDKQGFHYITAITKPQIETLLKNNVLQMSLFDTPLAEVTTDDGLRYVLRRNPTRAEELTDSRKSKAAAFDRALVAANQYLADHPAASAEGQLKKLKDRAIKLRISGWTQLNLKQRIITSTEDKEVLAEATRLDGCYVLKTDLPAAKVSKEIIHDRYKELALVEWAFRSSKTGHLEMRPIYVRREDRTRGHAFVVMLAYTIIQALAAYWRPFDITVQEGLDQLATVCLTEVKIADQPSLQRLPTPRADIKRLFDAAHVALPKKITHTPTRVATKTKLTDRRK